MSLVGFGLSLVLLASGEAHASCDAREISDLVALGEQAFTLMDADGFQTASSGLDRSLACQQEPLTSIQVASFHRIRALAAFFAADELATVLSFQAVLATMPGYLLPLEIAPEGHPLRQRYEEAKMFAPGEVLELPEPANGWVTVDGTRTRRAPAARPFVFQRLDADGAVVETRYVGVGTPMPDYPSKAPPRTQTQTPVPTIPERDAPDGVLLGTGILLGTVAAGLYGASFLMRNQYDAAVITGDAQRIRSRYWATNTLSGGSVVVLGAGAACVVVAF